MATGFTYASAGSILSSAMSATAQAASINNQDYRALVCVFLRGGNDSFNMLMPYTDHADYKQVRGFLGFDKDALKPLIQPGEQKETRFANQDNKKFAIHPALKKVRNLFREGDLNFVANVGSLEPDGRDPLHLFAHNHQQAFWETLAGHDVTASRKGWAARLWEEQGEGIGIPNNVAAHGFNKLFRGDLYVNLAPVKEGKNFHLITPSHAMRNDAGRGALNARGDDLFRFFLGHADGSMNNVIDSEYHHAKMFEQAYANRLINNIDQNGRFYELMADYNAAGADNQDFVAFQDGTPLQNQFEAVARLIKAGIQGDLEGQPKRQVFLINHSGYDTHTGQVQKHNELMAELDTALGLFAQTLKGIDKAWDATTSFIASDFGRTLTPNVDGTDHGWGGNYFVMGGSVNGGQILGKYPKITATDASVVRSKGRVIPTTAVEHYMAPMLKWLTGVEYGEGILPNASALYAGSMGKNGKQVYKRMMLV